MSPHEFASRKRHNETVTTHIIYEYPVGPVCFSLRVFLPDSPYTSDETDLIALDCSPPQNSLIC